MLVPTKRLQFLEKFWTNSRKLEYSAIVSELIDRRKQMQNVPREQREHQNCNTCYCIAAEYIEEE